jgi:hypothetical protein
MGLILSVLAILTFILLAKQEPMKERMNNIPLFCVTFGAFLFGCIRLGWWLMVYVHISVGGV